MHIVIHFHSIVNKGILNVALTILWMAYAQIEEIIIKHWHCMLEKKDY